MSLSRTMKITATFQAVTAGGVVSPNLTIKDMDLVVEQVQASEPILIPGSSTDYPIPFGAITNAKRIFLRTNYPVTLKVDVMGDTGFPWEGAGFLALGPGVSGMWMTTGPNETAVEVAVCGD